MTAQPTPGPAVGAGELDFARLPLSAAILANLGVLGYTAMTPIQAASLPLALAGHDLIAQAMTGSGKTAAFGLALLARLDLDRYAVQAMVMCPTRELGEQVATEIRRLARAQDNIKVLTLCGGTPIRGQVASLTHGAHIIVGTPGRIADHLQRETLRLDALNTLVLDEADRMLDMGFFDDIAAIIKYCPTERQTLLFSATFPEGIAGLARRFLRSPKSVKLPEQRAATSIRQRFYEIDRDERVSAVAKLLNHFRPVSTIAFCNTKHQCHELAQALREQGFQALELHGDLEQRDRDQVLVQFANRSCSVLVATDVAARGLDIAQLEAVINVEVTPDPEVHIHRIGRTGRMDEAGWALNLVSGNEMGRITGLEKMLGSEAQWYPVSELTPTGSGPLLAPMVTLQILGGRKDKIRPGDVLGALTGEAGFTAAQVGKIQVTDQSTYVAVDRAIARDALRKINAGKLKGKTVKARFL